MLVQVGIHVLYTLACAYMRVVVQMRILTHVRMHMHPYVCANASMGIYKYSAQMHDAHAAIYANTHMEFR